MQRYMIRRTNGDYFDCYEWGSRDSATLFKSKADALAIVADHPTYTIVTLDIDAAVKVLMALMDVHHLGNFVYVIRERELKGWEGPLVTKWGNASLEAQNLIDEYKKQTG